MSILTVLDWPRLVYTPSPGADYQPPEMAVGTEVTFHEAGRRELDGIREESILTSHPSYAWRCRPDARPHPARVLCDTPRGVQQIRVEDLSVVA